MFDPGSGVGYHHFFTIDDGFGLRIPGFQVSMLHHYFDDYWCSVPFYRSGSSLFIDILSYEMKITGIAGNSRE